MSQKKTNRSRAKAKGKAVVRKMYQRLKIDGSNYVVARDEPSFEFTEPVYVIRESGLPEVINFLALQIVRRFHGPSVRADWYCTEEEADSLRKDFASLGTTTGGART